MNNLKHWMLLGLGLVVIAGCSKKPKPTPIEPKPPEIEQAAPAAEPEKPVVDEAGARRRRIQARIAEVFQPVYFSYDQSTLSPEATATLQEIGKLMKEVSEISARIEGHADERGTNEYNLALGERRARAVQDYLTSYGVFSSKLSILSYGEEKPAIDAHDEASWSKNRRAEFTATF